MIDLDQCGQTSAAGEFPASRDWRDNVKPMLEYRVNARRIDAHGSIATTKGAEIALDTDIDGRPDAFNPAELFLGAVAACMIKGIERVTPMIKFNLRGVAVHLRLCVKIARPR
jgi:uncharacterized OsmC-like protein